MGGERMRRVDPIGGLGILFLVGGLLAVLSRCQVIPPNEPEPAPGPGPDAAPEACKAACANLARMLCPWAEPTPGQDDIVGTEDDGQCVDVCRAAEESIETTLNPVCVAAADSCESAEACIK
jgi:hypothetical protein